MITRYFKILIVIIFIFVLSGTAFAYDPPDSTSQHSTYTPKYSGGCGVSAACHTVNADKFLPASINSIASTDFTNFCLGCHNVTGEAHERAAGSSSTNQYVNYTGLGAGPFHGDSHSWNGVIGSADTRIPMLPGFKNSGVDGTNYMPNGNRVTCQVCHQGMSKVREDDLDWRLTTTVDDTNFVIDDGFGTPLTETKQYLSHYKRVYRSTGLIGKPIRSRTKMLYRVDPSEYFYDYSTATVTFLSAQDPADYIYVDITQPYFREGNEANAICLDCHFDRTDSAVSHEPGTGARDNHPAGADYGFLAGLHDTLKPSPDGNIYIEGVQVLCTSCHDPHNAASNDGQITRSANSSELCTDCHETNGFDGYSTAFLANHNGGKHSAPTECLDCHTTHDTDNILLIKDRINGKAVSFRNFSGAQSFGNETGSSVCEACHTATDYHRNDAAYNTANPHQSSKDCTECHTHAKGFEGGGCNGCHGNPPTSAGELVVVPSATGSSTSGAHSLHVGTRGYNCNTCHKGGMVSASEANYIIELGFSFNGYTTGTYDGQSLINGYSYSAPNTSGGSMECSGLYCHGATMAPNGGADTVPAWGSSVSCGDCHGATAANPPTRGSHARHAGNGVGQMNYGCTLCHSGYSDVHVNGLSEVSFSGSDSRTEFGEYTGTPQMLDAYGSCGNLYCHSNADPLDAAVSYASPAWGGSTGCTSCHGGSGSTGTMSTRHAKHVDTYGFACSKCHNATVSSGDSPVTGYTMHVDGAKDVVFDGTNGSGDYSSAPTCASMYCHGDGVSTGSAAWNGGDTTCTSCHDYTVASGSAMATNRHDEHISGGSLASFECSDCHTRTVASNNTTILYANGKHVDAVKTVAMSFNGYTGSYTGSFTCINTYCHSSGQTTPAYRVTPDWTGATTLDCDGCHGSEDTVLVAGAPEYANVSTADRNSFNSHDKHAALGSDCVKCHDTTVDSGKAIIASSDHLSGAREVSFIKGGNYNVTTKRCDNTDCHGVTVMRWGGSLPASCNSCHTDQGAGTDGSHGYTGKHSVHTNTYGFACEVCHATKNASGNTDHAGGDVSTNHAAEVFFNTSATVWTSLNYDGGGTSFKYVQMDAALGLTGITPVYTPWTTTSPLSDPLNSNRKWTEGRCDSVWCHSNANPLGGSMTYVSFANWSGSESTSCTSCHGGPGAYADIDLSAAHRKHAGTDRYGFTCSKCHNDTVSSGDSPVTDYTKHVDGTKTVAFDTDNSSGSYAGTTCSTMDCHGDGVSTGSADWSTAYTCTGCHDYTVASGSPMATNRHDEHISGGNLASFECSDCHTRTVASNNTTILYANGKHVDFAKTVAIKSFNSYTGSYTGSFTCINTYCHSSGQAAPAFRVTPVWTGAPTLDCDGCHGSEGASYVAGAPEYANVSTADRNSFNGHYVAGHVSAASDCVKCHTDTVDGAGAVKAGSLHLDGSRDVVFALGGTYSDKRCSDTDTGCHGATVMRWGGSGGCMDCHKSTSGETDDYNYGTLPKATVNFYEWTSVGHGKTGTYRYTGNAGANKGCEDCHGSSHGFPTNPFRLMSSTVIKPSQPDTLCLQSGCHDTGISNHDFAHVAQGTWNWTPKCVDCHDPHGDSGGVSSSEYNGAMVQREVSYTVSNAYGVPGTTEGVDFPANYARARGLNLFNWSSFVVTTGQSNKGVCRVCHTEATTSYFTRTAYDGTHKNDQGSCVSCHVHSQGFKPSCDSCHGYPPNTTDANEDNVGAVGAHDKHVSGEGLSCYDCHKGNTHNEASVTAPYTSLVTPTFVNMSVSSEYNLHGTKPSYNGTPGSWTPYKTCGTTACHYDESPSWECQ